ncbi:hypothetical protein ACFOUP_10915 [Belliella kenyensis]|uniref:Uncharacterized protein n=1 Tax=Belliella kenyensis TaxID=1472724 RepID=A0ABV8EMI0_9BACT|nr:hypothetical protein [Belliella kenyensis]MCH7403661.1 hypothetical protein [Belliella kenyensis]MDN3602185.1 hypothetical protein [Belliella kenyensis]
MIRRLLTFIFLLSCIHQISNAQDVAWGQPKAIKLERITGLSIDNQESIFIGTSEGDLYQFDEDGVYVNNFSPSRQSRVDFIEAAWTVNVFTFSVDLQEYRLFDRFLNPLSEIAIQTKGVNLAKAATIGNNNIIWVYDESDFCLKQFDHRRNQITQQQPLNLILNNSDLNVLEVKEYQNMVFVNIKNEGISILDNQANLIKTINIKITGISFDKENLIYNQSNQLVLHNFISDTKAHYTLPVEVTNHKVVTSKKNVIFYNSEEILIYKKPKNF